jgi:hypothetical protein
VIVFPLFATGVIDNGGKFAGSVVDTGSKLPPVSLIPAAYLLPVLLTPVAYGGRVVFIKISATIPLIKISQMIIILV